MIRLWHGMFVLGPVLLGALVAPGWASEALTVCLDRSVPVAGGKGAIGFDGKVAEAVARHLDQPLVVQWFESKIDPDSSSTLAANALLSDGRCQIVGGYPLLADALGKPAEATARLPDFEGKKPSDRVRRVALGELLASTPYHFEAITVVLGSPGPSRAVSSLGDLRGLKIGVESGTLADAALMSFGDGVLVDDLIHVVPGRDDVLSRLEHGDFAATLVDMRRFDAYRAANPTTTLRSSGYYYRIGFNMGFVALATQRDLLARLDAVIGAMLADSEMPDLAAASGTTWVAPRQPYVLEHILLKDLRH